MRVLVAGGAGYIGSHVVKALLEGGHETITYDNLSKGHVEALHGGEFIQGDILDQDRLSRVLQERKVDLVIHLAADTAVGESMVNPAKYYWNNVVGGLKLLDSMRSAGVKYIVFSSSAAVYGEPAHIPIREDAPCNPTNVYGETKLIFERMLASYDRSYGLKYVSFRYFNAAGADPSGAIGEDHDPETQLIPLVLQTALGLRPSIEIFGTDYDTPDGTCIRDFIHVSDLASAHVLAAEALLGGMGSRIYNLGNETGNSVREVIRVCEEVVGHKIPVKEGPRRPGDPAMLVASSELARRELGWTPRFPDLKDIVATAWNWHRNHPYGFAGARGR
ncbi:MAG TPA: UDP-glucose 4-epimerase GalE [Firmicutes bacterium]|nr:UDP-glucose 4-epimerase GalE [Bacillota bacterium]